MGKEDSMGPSWQEYQHEEEYEDQYDALRSSDMVQLNISFPDDGDLPHHVIKELAQTKYCQFEDMLCQKLKDGKESSVPSTQRRFRTEMAMAQDCSRILRILREEVMTMWDNQTIVDDQVVEFIREDKFDEEGRRAPTEWATEFANGFTTGKNLSNAHRKLKGWLDGISRDNNALGLIMSDINRFVEEKAVMELSGDLLAEISDSHSQNSQFEMAHVTEGKVPLMADGVELQDSSGLESGMGQFGIGHIGHCVGVISTDKLEGMRVKLHVAMRGNAILNHREIESPICDPLTGEKVNKCCFVVYYQSDSQKIVEGKILRLTKAFGATIYNPPAATEARQIKIQELRQDIQDRESAVAETVKQKFNLLSDFYTHAVTLRKFVLEEKLIFYTLNKCSDQSEDGTELVNRTITRLRALVWTPAYAVPIVKDACRRANQACADSGAVSGNLVLVKSANPKPDVVRPTFSRTNRFTQGFQAIVDGYGIPDYKEVNPTLFATAMFPFLFGVMFGDLVHGLLMTIFAGFLIFKEETFLAMDDRNEIFEYLFSGRYTIFMMGICATYMGLIYNEALSCSIDFFGSAYSYSYICTSTFAATSAAHFPEYAGHRGADYNGISQYTPQGCTEETMADTSANNCWKYLADYNGVSLYDKLPCGVSSEAKCPIEVLEAMGKCPGACATAASGCTNPTTGAAGCTGTSCLAPAGVTLKKTPFVVPANYDSEGDDDGNGFLPSDVGQPVGLSHFSTKAAEPAEAKYRAYPFGVDPVWRYSTQNIQFTNSLKMKMSVILGVSQMIVGILLKWMNTFHFKKWGYLCSVCIPELLFMTCTFGYMCFLIFVKWSTDYSQGQPGKGVPCWESCPTYPDAADVHSTTNGYGPAGCYREPPMIITTLIGMFMSTGTVGQDQTDKWQRCKFFLFESQETIQVFFLIIALICVPWLFAVEPILVKREHDEEVRKRERGGMVAHTSEDSAEENEELDDEDPLDDGFAMGDVIVGQAIHAIEFILGCVSNTASYLRLWALSLAHSQLSEVFWEYIFKGYEIELLGGQYPGLASKNVAFIIACYFVFFLCTIAVLMVMESLSAFLHALRLQWVEFQNKFYHATGYKFHPLDFEDQEMPFDIDN